MKRLLLLSGFIAGFISGTIFLFTPYYDSFMILEYTAQSRSAQNIPLSMIGTSGSLFAEAVLVLPVICGFIGLGIGWLLSAFAPKKTT